MLDLKSHDSFAEILTYYDSFDFGGYLESVSSKDIETTLKKESLNQYDFLNLLSKKAGAYLEEMAIISKKHKIRHFGNVILLYLPIYVSNYCNSNCEYCGFSKKNKITRRHLNKEQLHVEAKEIAKNGIKHILLLTGEAKSIADLDYLKMCIKVLKEYFSSISIEVYPLEKGEYKQLKELGVDGLTIYQEVYDTEVYKSVHTSGKKTDYNYRLEAPQRGAEAGFRSINIGVLFGLGEIQKEAFFSGVHARYLMDKFPHIEISLSLPRINSAEGNFQAKHTLSDRDFVQFMLAYRLFMPSCGINISTRESADFRDNLINIGATKFSAGSKTDVGGYSNIDKSTAQFDISDQRSVQEIVSTIRSKGQQPLFKDWEMMSER